MSARVHAYIFIRVVRLFIGITTAKTKHLVVIEEQSIQRHRWSGHGLRDIVRCADRARSRHEAEGIAWRYGGGRDLGELLSEPEKAELGLAVGHGLACANERLAR